MIEQNVNETKFEYGLRLIEAKMEKTDDIEWQDIVDVIGLNVHYDTLRKACQGEYGSYNVLKYFKEKYSNIKYNEDEAVNELDIKLRELKKERKKIQTESLEYNKMLREQARDEMIVEKIRDIIPTCPVIDFKPLMPKQVDMEWVLAFGDIHFDKFFESVNNNYSTDEIERRFSVLLGETVRAIQKEEISHLTIINLGDSLEGLLRISALRTMRHGMLNSVVLVSRLIGDWLNALSKYVTITYRHVETANHTEVRLFNQKRGETDENLELVIINYIHDYVRENPRVEVVIVNNNYLTFKLFDYEVIALHGDAVKSSKDSLKNLSMLHRKFYDYVFMGHFHSGMTQTVYEGVDNNREVIVCPSIVGSDPYSDSLFVGSKSSAKLFGFRDGKGLVENKTFILN